MSLSTISYPITAPGQRRLLSRWTLARTLALLVAMGYVFLFFDVRYEHRETLAEHPTAWIPVILSVVGVLAGVVAVAIGRRGGRVGLGVVSAVAILVGFIGIWHHTDGNPFLTLRVLTLSAGTVRGEVAMAQEEDDEQTTAPVSANTGERQAFAPETETEAPLLAPLAFAGLGMFGLLAVGGRDINRD